MDNLPNKKRFHLIRATQLKDLDEPSWLVDGVLPCEALTLFYGAPGHAKTFFALDIAASIASATPWHGRSVTPGAVVYVVAEGVRGLQARVEAWAHARRVAIPERLFIGTDAVQLHLQEDPDEFVRDVRAQVNEPISLVVLDTLARCFRGGEENSAKDTGLLVHGADLISKELDATVLLVHHARKEGDVERGSSALSGAVDTMFSVRLTKPKLTVRCRKQKDAAEFDKFDLRLTPTLNSCALTDPGTPLFSPRALDLLRTLVENDSNAGVKSSAWRASSGFAETTFHRSRNELLSGGLVVKKGSLYTATAEGVATIGGENRPLLTLLDDDFSGDEDLPDPTDLPEVV